MTIKERNYWLDTVAEPATGATGALPEKVDVAIVGGGFCGLSAARVLAQRGVRVALFEAETFGWGASSRNGGMVLTGMKLPGPTLVKSYGREDGRREDPAAPQTIEFGEEIGRGEKIHCNLSPLRPPGRGCKAAHFHADRGYG